MIVLPFRVMTAEVSVKVAVQPLSHNCPMDMREPDARVGNRWTSLAAEGKFGNLRFAVCVAWMLSLLGRRTLIPLDTGRMLVRGRSCEVDG